MVTDITIGVDLSTTSTGYVIYNVADNKILFSTVLKPQAGLDNGDMISVVSKRLNMDVNRARQLNKRVTVVVEDYTDTMNHNDRSGVASTIVGMKDELLAILRVNNVDVATAVPWSWRRVYGLHTKVDHPDVKHGKVARILGHDILKAESLSYVNNELGFDLLEDDIADALLIALSFVKTGNKLQNAQYYNPRRLTADDVIEYAEALVGTFGEVEEYVNTKRGKVWIP